MMRDASRVKVYCGKYLRLRHFKRSSARCSRQAPEKKFGTRLTVRSGMAYKPPIDGVAADFCGGRFCVFI
jgi:hypothetical protein